VKANNRATRIEWGDCDPAGIVYYPRYFEFFDTSTTHLLEATSGLRKRDMLAEFGLAGWPMVDTRARFERPLRFGDECIIESAFTELGRSSFKIHHRLSLEGELAVEGWETRVFVSGENGSIRATPIPATLIEKIRNG
jgi:4-hydroxybenzoyl-CoA thioesterase